MRSFLTFRFRISNFRFHIFALFAHTMLRHGILKISLKQCAVLTLCIIVLFN